MEGSDYLDHLSSHVVWPCSSPDLFRRELSDEGRISEPEELLHSISAMKIQTSCDISEERPHFHLTDQLKTLEDCDDPLDSESSFSRYVDYEFKVTITFLANLSM